MTRQGLSLVGGVGLITLLCVSSRASAQVSPGLGNAGSYSVLAGTQVTNAGATSISSDVGISPGAGAVGANHPGLLPAMVLGTIHDKDLAAQNAQFDQAAAYTQLDLLNGCTVTYPAGVFKELAGSNLGPGVYCAASGFHLSGGQLTLVGTASDTWVFKSGVDLVISGGAAARVVSPSCNVWWRVVSSATFDAGSSLLGNILADTSITFAAGASLGGRAFARTAEVTLSSNAINACATNSPPTPTPTPTPTPSPTPRPNACASTAPDLFLVKRHTDTFVAGVNATYTIAVFNNGTTSSGPITVTDTLPVGMTFVSAAGVSWACSAVGQIVTCTSTASIPGPITLTVTPLGNAVPSVTNNAVIAGGGDCDATNNATSDVTLVSAAVPGTPTPVAPTPVPTLSEWAFITLAVLLAGAGVVALRRRASI